MPETEGRDWSVYELARFVLRLERTTDEDINRLRVRMDDHEKVHVSKESFDSLRSTLRQLALLVVTQVIIIIGALVVYAVTK